MGAEGGGHGAGGGLERAPCVVGVFHNGSTRGVDKLKHITLNVGDIVVFQRSPHPSFHQNMRINQNNQEG